MKYFKGGTWVNDDTITVLPAGATALTDAEWDNRQGTPYVPTLPEIKTAKLAQINSAHNTAIRSPVNYTGANMAQPAWQALVTARDYAAFMRINALITAVNAAQNPGAVDAINW